MEDNIPVAHAEAIIKIDAWVEAALQRWFGIHLPLKGGGAQQQGCPSAPLVYKNNKHINSYNLSGGRATTVAACISGSPYCWY
jgi:hypothetical protein